MDNCRKTGSMYRLRMIGFILAFVVVFSTIPFGKMTARAEGLEDFDFAELAASNVGDIITFGHYEQDGNTANGKEAIEWQILSKESNRVLLISKYVLDCQPYSSADTNVTWETCSLRKWLNSDFYNTAFSGSEKNRISLTTLVNENNPYNGTTGGKNTNDKVFCLSVNDLKKYFGNYQIYSDVSMWGYNYKLICTPTQYAINRNGGLHNCMCEITNEVYTGNYYFQSPIPPFPNMRLSSIYPSSVVGRTSSDWWLRTIGLTSKSACNVDAYGQAGAWGMSNFAYTLMGVRPAMYIELPSPNGIGLNYDSFTIQKGECRKIVVTVVPADAYDTSVTWSSSNPAVATVDNSGNVKAVGPGTVKITAGTINGLTKSCTVKVVVKPTSIELSENSVTLIYGEEKKLNVVLAPADVTEKSITWTSSDASIASVNNGMVKARKAGKATITAKTVNGLTAQCSIAITMDNDPSNPFADLKAEGWQYNAAKYVYDNEYMKGKGEVTPGKVLFAPNDPIDRSQFVQTLYNVEGRPAVTYVQKFSDVKASDWFAKPVTWAAQNQIVGGNPDGTFGVTGRATREQMARMFYSYAVYKGYDTSVVPGQGKCVSDFTDASLVSSWAETALNWALSHGVMSGKGDKLDPKGSATRAECATMIRNFQNTFKNAPLTFGVASDGMEEEDVIIIEVPVEEDVVDETVEDNKIEEPLNEDVINPEEEIREEIQKEEIDDEVTDDEINTKEKMD